MNTIMVIVLKVLFPYGLSLSYIMIHSVIFRNGPTNVSNLGKRVPVPCLIPSFPPRRGLGHDRQFIVLSFFGKLQIYPSFIFLLP